MRGHADIFVKLNGWPGIAEDREPIGVNSWSIRGIDSCDEILCLPVLLWGPTMPHQRARSSLSRDITKAAFNGPPSTLICKDQTGLQASWLQGGITSAIRQFHVDLRLCVPPNWYPTMCCKTIIVYDQGRTDVRCGNVDMACNSQLIVRS